MDTPAVRTPSCSKSASSCSTSVVLPQPWPHSARHSQNDRPSHRVHQRLPVLHQHRRFAALAVTASYVCHGRLFLQCHGIKDVLLCRPLRFCNAVMPLMPCNSAQVSWRCSNTHGILHILQQVVKPNSAVKLTMHEVWHLLSQHLGVLSASNTNTCMGPQYGVCCATRSSMGNVMLRRSGAFTTQPHSLHEAATATWQLYLGRLHTNDQWPLR